MISPHPKQEARQKIEQHPYSSSISGKAAMVDETITVLREINRGGSVAKVKDMVIDDDLLGKTSRYTRRDVWKNIHSRFLSDERRLRILARMVVESPDRQTGQLVLFYEMCRGIPILHDTIIECVYSSYAAGYSIISKNDIQTYFDEIADVHPELTEWSPQTRDKVASNILTILRDFGLLEGTQKKYFTRLYVPIAAFVYVLYRLAEDGLTTVQALLDTKEWPLFLLDEQDVIDFLKEASAAGHCTFKQQGDIYSLDLHYSSLEVYVDVLTR